MLELGAATMYRGELAEFVCRAKHAYGDAGRKEGGSAKFLVPPRATVRFEVELYSWSGFRGDRAKMNDAEVTCTLPAA